MNLFNFKKEEVKENMNNYKKKRLKSKLSVYTMARELGIDRDKYLAIESGDINLEGDKLDIFNKTIENSKMININRFGRIADIEEYVRKGKMKHDMKKRGYTGLQLSDKLHINNGELSRVMNLKDGYNKDILEMVYDFLQDPTNANIKPRKYTKRITTRTDIEEDVENDKNNQIRNIMEKHDISAYEISTELGKSKTYLGKILVTPDKYSKSRDFVLKYLLENYGDNNENRSEVELVQEIPIEVNEQLVKEVEEEKSTIDDLVNAYKPLISNDNKEMLEEENKRLKKQLERYEKLIDLITL